MLIAANTLTQFVTVLFTSAGVTAENSAIVASHLVDANLKGHDSHGVGMIPHYIPLMCELLGGALVGH